MTAFVSQHRVRSSQCGPKERLQTARYFELINRVVEEWCDASLELSFASMHARERRLGLPTVQINLEVQRAIHLGEDLQLLLNIVQLRRSAIQLTIRAHCEDQPRFSAEVTLVLAQAVGGKLQGMEIPPTLRQTMMQYALDNSIGSN